jgi:hypothetical protein
MFPHDGVRRRWWINVESESQAFDKSRVDSPHRNDERPDWHQALRPNDGWSAYHRSDTTNKDAPAGKHRTT